MAGERLHIRVPQEDRVAQRTDHDWTHGGRRSQLLVHREAGHLFDDRKVASHRGSVPLVPWRDLGKGTR